MLYTVSSCSLQSWCKNLPSYRELKQKSDVLKSQYYSQRDTQTDILKTLRQQLEEQFAKVEFLQRLEQEVREGRNIRVHDHCVSSEAYVLVHTWAWTSRSSCSSMPMYGRATPTKVLISLDYYC